MQNSSSDDSVDCFVRPVSLSLPFNHFYFCLFARINVRVYNALQKYVFVSIHAQQRKKCNCFIVVERSPFVVVHTHHTHTTKKIQFYSQHLSVALRHKVYTLCVSTLHCLLHSTVHDIIMLINIENKKKKTTATTTKRRRRRKMR